jgi:hypothetical protein
MLWGAGALAAGPAPSVRGPFDTLEADLRKEAARTTASWRQAPAAGRPALEAALKAAFEGLHDIRHYAAFGELWDRWSFAGETLDVLYPASGAHLAPLEFVHRGRLREASFTFTEIDAAMIPRLEANLLRLVKLGFYSDLAAALTPLPPRPGEQGIPIPQGGEPARVQAWIRESIRTTGTAPPLEAAFTFRYRGTRVRLRLLLKASSTHPGSTEYYRGEDLAKADLVVTHDISFDPREHLAFLRSCIESSCAQERRRPIAVMMEDLALHPARLDLSPFGVLAATRLSYGHAAFVQMPDGTRIEAEDGPPLYEGAVLLEPDLSLWRGLTPPERTALFNLVLLRDHGFDRRNVDLVGGRRVEAPAILDWHMGYGHKDVDGRDLRGRKGFLAALAGACISTAGRLPDGPLRGWLCSSLDAFRSTLERIASRDGRAAVRAAAAASSDHPFLSAPETRKQFQTAVSGAESVGKLLQADGVEAGTAVRELDSARVRAAGCGPVPGPPSTPSPAAKETRP